MMTDRIFDDAHGQFLGGDDEERMEKEEPEPPETTTEGQHSVASDSLDPPPLDPEAFL